MNQTPPETTTALLAFTGFWLVMVIIILLAGRFVPAIGSFRERMLAQWKPAVVITVILVISLLFSGNTILNPIGVAILCQAMIGLAIASSIPGYSALPVSKAIKERQHVVRQIALLLGVTLIAAIFALAIGSVGISIGRQIFGEANYTQQAQSSLPTINKWLAFFPLLGGAGIAEETPYRLVLLSLVWKLSNRKWLAIVVSALVFAAYHLTPLDGMYRIFWQFPISQFAGSLLIGLVWGYLFVKRGYGSAVLGHTLSNWLPLMVFA